MPCLDENTLCRFLGAELSDAEEEAIERHLDGCVGCQERLEKLERSAPEKSTVRYVREGLVCQAITDDFVEEKGLETTLLVDGANLEKRGKDEVHAEIPSEIGPYRITDLLGRGGMGNVYRGEHTLLKRAAAIKMVRESRRPHWSNTERFYREMEAIGKLRHPNIVQAFDAGECDGHPYIVMELLEGTDLLAFVKENGFLMPTDALPLIRQAALGLKHAHENGLIHRDVKPSNLWLTDDGTVKVLDLGLARMAESTIFESATGQIVGSRGFLSPEQAQGLNVDCRSDIYSLGCALYFLLTGTTLSSDDEPEMRFPDLAPLLQKMLAVDPDRRFSSMREVVSMIDKLTSNQKPALVTTIVVSAILAAVALGSGVAVRSTGIFDQQSGPSFKETKKDDLSGSPVLSTATTNDEPWMTTPEVAEYLSVSRDTVYRWIDKQGLPAHRAGRAWRFRKSEIDAWVTTQNKDK